MKRQPWILAGTALGLLMAAPLAAAPVRLPEAPKMGSADLPLLLAQDEAAPAPESSEPPPPPPAEAEPAPAPEPEAAPEPEPEPRAEPAPEAAPVPEAAAPEPAPEPQAEPAPEPAPAPEAVPSEDSQPAPEAPAVEEPSLAEPQPAAPAEPAPPAEAAPAAPEAPAAPSEPVTPAPEAPAVEQAPAVPEPKIETPQQAPEGSQAPQPAAPADGGGAVAPEPTAPVPAAPAETPAPAAPAPDATAPAPAPAEAPPAPAAPATEAAPVPALPPGEAPSPSAIQVAPAGQAAQPVAPAAPAAPPGPPPASDSAAQQVVPQVIVPVREEAGTRRREGGDPTDEPRRRERPEGVEVVREVGDRTIIQINNQVIVESNDRPRLTRGARDVYYEDLPRGRTRETIEREDGSQVVTVRNAYGDVVRRSRITPEGREYVLSYVADDDYERVRDWRDPGLDLPPLRLSIPADEYILDAEEVDDEDAYYDFLDQPPVEQVERLYSVDEVKRSSRIRQKTRRVDLDTITFDFGSASISESEVRKLENVATAMERLLERNPAETFLIEGHTDAVGTDVANLALSDRRAESVAEALTNVFGIPPENLTTQGYGEQYLKVNTQEPDRQNRRVALRRITALEAPVSASAQ